MGTVPPGSVLCGPQMQPGGFSPQYPRMASANEKLPFSHAALIYTLRWLHHPLTLLLLISPISMSPFFLLAPCFLTLALMTVCCLLSAV